MSHSEVGPSAAHRWMACPGSVQLNAELPDETSKYAEEGRAAHELAEWKLYSKLDMKAPEAMVKKPPEAWDEEMEEMTDVYVNLILGELNRCRVKQLTPIQLHIEAHVVLNEIDNRLYGTVDAMFYSQEEGRVYVFDLKYGKGVYVTADDNPQLQYYALGGYYQNFARHVRSYIVQPRLENISYKDYTASEMEDFEESLIVALKAVDETPNKFTSGEKQCRFCKAKGLCPALTTKYVSMLSKKGPLEIQLESTDRLTNTELSHIFNKKAEIINYLKSLENIVQHKLTIGEDVPQAKLVETKGAGTWKDGTVGTRWHEDYAESFTPAELQRTDKMEHKLLCKIPLIAVPITDKRTPVYPNPLEFTPTQEGEINE